MAQWMDGPVVAIGIIVGVFLIVAGLGTLITAPWQYHGSQAVTVLRIVGTLGTILIGAGLVYLVWGQQWLAQRRSAS